MPDLSEFRETLDIINRQLIERIAYRFAASPEWQELEANQAQPELPKGIKVDFILRFYEIIAAGLRNDRLRTQVGRAERGSRAVRRLLSGTDFPELDGLTDQRFRMLQYVLNPEDENTRTLLQHRFRLIEEIGEYKKSHALVLRDPAREQALIGEARAFCRNFGVPEIVGAILYVNLLLPAAFEVEELIAER